MRSRNSVINSPFPPWEPTFSRKQNPRSLPCTAGTAQASGGKPFPGRMPSSNSPKLAYPSSWPNSTWMWTEDPVRQKGNRFHPSWQAPLLRVVWRMSRECPSRSPLHFDVRCWAINVRCSSSRPRPPPRRRVPSPSGARGAAPVNRNVNP